MAHSEGVPGIPEELARLIERMGGSMEDKIKKWREAQEKLPGMRDSVLLSRIDFREAMSLTFSEAGGNVPNPGPLYALTCIYGSDGSKRLAQLYGGIMEEALFGTPGGEKPKFRTDFGESEDEYKTVVSGMAKTLGNFARDNEAEAGEKAAGFGEFVTAAIQSFGELVAKDRDYKEVGAVKVPTLFMSFRVTVALFKSSASKPSSATTTIVNLLMAW